LKNRLEIGFVLKSNQVPAGFLITHSLLAEKPFGNWVRIEKESSSSGIFDYSFAPG
jgi:hypothetical protein